MKRKYLIILIVFCILVVPYVTITTIAVGPYDLFNLASIVYFPGVVMQLIANEGNGIICSDACGLCSAWGPWYILIDGECTIPDSSQTQLNIISKLDKLTDDINGEETIDNLAVHNTPVVKNCIPKTPDQAVINIDYKNSTHYFDVRTCEWFDRK